MERLVTPLGLGLLVLASAMLLVYYRYEARREFVQLQSLRNDAADLRTEWSRLQLERTTLSDPRRIEPLAQERLQMQRPSGAQFQVLKP